MRYADMRPVDQRSFTSHMNETPERSPCIGCENESEDKTKCSETCRKLKSFQNPRQLHIDHRTKSISKLEELFEPKIEIKPKKPPRGTSCSIGMCKRAATRMGFKALYAKPLCESCRRKLAYRLQKYGSIRDPKTGRI